MKGRVFAAFLLVRLLLLFTLPWEGVLAYGDLLHYYNVAALPGWPLRDYWVEYPPLWPWLAELLYRMVQGNQTAFVYAAALLFSAAQAGAAALLWEALDDLWPRQEALRRAGLFIALTGPLFYTWAYFDPLPLFFWLAAWHAWRKGRDGLTGLWVAVGGLFKWFPLLLLPAWWRAAPRRAWRSTGIALGLLALLWAAAFRLSPTMAQASLLSQTQKGSWETVWALVDGNLRTGLFGPLRERFDPQAALRKQGKPARVPPWATLVVFGALGLVAWARFSASSETRTAGFVGLTWVLFALWSPGYSVQWLLYGLPWLLLALPWPQARVLAPGLVVAHVLEWPILLSRGLWWGLWLTVPLRTLLLALAGVRLAQAVFAKGQSAASTSAKQTGLG